ncbi:hypothetical protein [Williamsia muralis]|uniref:hypothetical protein n=1 Tax=Williamsia marianensis TaxID=85044 RepID=UPI003821702C
MSSDDARSQHDQRVELLTAIAAALDRPHDVVDVCMQRGDEEAMRTALMDLLGVTALGADAVVSMQLRRFRRDSAEGIRRELAELVQNPPRL